jgi:hypothetical protein
MEGSREMGEQHGSVQFQSTPPPQNPVLFTSKRFISICQWVKRNNLESWHCTLTFSSPWLRASQLRRLNTSQVLVAHAYNSSYSGSRDQEDSGSKPDQANSSARAYLEKPFTKIGVVEWLK